MPRAGSRISVSEPQSCSETSQFARSRPGPERESEGRSAEKRGPSQAPGLARPSSQLFAQSPRLFPGPASHLTIQWEDPCLVQDSMGKGGSGSLDCQRAEGERDRLCLLALRPQS